MTIDIEDFLPRSYHKQMNALSKYGVNLGEKKISEEEFRKKNIPYEPIEPQEELVNYFNQVMNSKEKVHMLLGFRGCSKTAYITLYSVAKWIYYNRKSTGGILTREATRSYEIIRAIGHILKENKVRGDFTSTGIQLEENKGNQNLTLKSLTVDGSKKGKHMDYLIMDDPLESKDEYSQAKKRMVKKAYLESLNICRKMIILGQYVAEDDLYCEIEKNVETTYFWVNKVKGYEDYKVGDKAIFDLDSSKHTRREWGKNYEGIFYENEYSILGQVKIENFDKNLTVAYIDPAYGGDYTAISIGGVYDGVLYVYGKAIKKSIVDCYEEVKGYLLPLDKIYIEAYGLAGKLTKEFLKKNLKNVFTDADNRNKKARIISLEVPVKTNRIVLHSESDYEYIRQVKNYSVEMNLNDDAPDSLAGVYNKLKYLIK